MAFHGSRIPELIERFGLTYHALAELFPTVPPIEPGPMLSYYLASPAHWALAQRTESARREAIIAPFLYEAAHRAGVPTIVFSGMALDVADGLSGYCDFILGRGSNPTFIEAPILVVVEAKDDRMGEGLGQCAAEIVAAREFNRARAKNGEKPGPVYGAVTNGAEWEFLKLDGDHLMRNKDQYYLSEAPRILGVLIAIAAGTA